MKLPSALAPFQVCPLRYRRHLTTAPFAKKTSPRACGSLSASAWVVWESAEGMKPPSASALLHAGFHPLPQPLHAVALHGFAKGRYAIKRSPFAGCWCMGSLDMQRPSRRSGKALSAAPVVVYGGIQHNGVLCKAQAPGIKPPAHRVRIRGRYVLRPSGKCRHTSQGQCPSPSSRGSKTGLVLRRPSAFCCVVGCAGLSCLFICCRFAFCLLSPAHPACQAARGRAALLLSRSPATLPVRPKWLPKNR